MQELAKFTDLRATVILGGDKCGCVQFSIVLAFFRLDDQFSDLHQNPDIVVATPGRFLHVLVEMGLSLSTVEYVVFDEADRCDPAIALVS